MIGRISDSGRCRWMIINTKRNSIFLRLDVGDAKDVLGKYSEYNNLLDKRRAFSSTVPFGFKVPEEV